jgi:hypothetical protein
MWNGTAASAVDLHPASGFQSSFATAASDSGQPGFGVATASGRDHALLWSGTAASKVDLQPSVYGANRALGLDGNTQVGYAFAPRTMEARQKVLKDEAGASTMNFVLERSKQKPFDISGCILSVQRSRLHRRHH